MKINFKILLILVLVLVICLLTLYIYKSNYSLEIFQEAGMKSLRQKSEKLTSYLELLINSEFEKQIEIITPISTQSRGCQLSLRLLKPVSDITKRLNERGVICDWRKPDVLRVAPVPMYNSFEDCYNFVEILKNILNEC